MKNNITELVFILDRSGSMSGLESEVLHDCVKLGDIPKMTDRDYTVRGCIALIDAIGGAIHHIGNIHKYARPKFRYKCICSSFAVPLSFLSLS